MRTIQLECIIYRKVNNHFEFLLLKRIPSKGGFWQPVCGGLEEGETKIDACYREILEETGISKEKIVNVIKEVHHFVINKDYLSKNPISPQEEFVFGFEINSSEEINIDSNIQIEHEAYKWVSFDDAINLLKWKNNKDAFEKLHSKLKDIVQRPPTDLNNS